jgi:hypothetical protein
MELITESGTITATKAEEKLIAMTLMAWLEAGVPAAVAPSVLAISTIRKGQIEGVRAMFLSPDKAEMERIDAELGVKLPIVVYHPSKPETQRTKGFGDGGSQRAARRSASRKASRKR